MTARIQSVARESFAIMFVGESIESVERRLIYLTLQANGGNKRAAAHMLGVSLKTIYNKLAHYERSHD